jgi:hypothetical protein
MEPALSGLHRIDKKRIVQHETEIPAVEKKKMVSLRNPEKESIGFLLELHTVLSAFVGLQHCLDKVPDLVGGR